MSEDKDKLKLNMLVESYNAMFRLLEDILRSRETTDKTEAIILRTISHAETDLDIWMRSQKDV